MTHRIAIIYDISKKTADGQEYGWAYFLRAKSLQKYAPSDFQVDIFAFKDVPWMGLGWYKLVFNLEYAAPSRGRIPSHVPLVVSFNSDSRRRQHYLPPVKREATYVVFNNMEAFNDYGRFRNSCCISNGIDSELWYSEVPIAERPHKLLWCGSSTERKGKGYQEVFQPLEKIAAEHGFETDFRPINDINERLVKPFHLQREWYNSGSYVLCASLTEGTPGFFLEGMACGCVGVTVRVGNAQEFGEADKNVLFVDKRTSGAFLETLKHAREHRERLSAAGADTMHNGWSYGEPGRRADYFFALFRAIIGGRLPKPFAYNELSPEEI